MTWYHQVIKFYIYIYVDHVLWRRMGSLNRYKWYISNTYQWTADSPSQELCTQIELCFRLVNVNFKQYYVQMLWDKSWYTLLPEFGISAKLVIRLIVHGSLDTRLCEKKTECLLLAISGYIGVSEVTLMDMDETDGYQSPAEHIKLWTVWIFPWA